MAELVAYQDGKRLVTDDPVEPCSTINIWPLAPIRICVRMHCCLAGIKDATVRVAEDYAMDGRKIGTRLEDIFKPGTHVANSSGAVGTVVGVNPAAKEVSG